MDPTEQSSSGGAGSEELLTVAEAGLRYGLPGWKIRKLIEQHQLPGARKARGENGWVWRIPVAAFESLGYEQQAPPSAAPGATVTLELTELRRTINGLTGSLRIERQRLANKQQELEDALLQIGERRRQLRYQRTRAEDAERQVARLRAAAVDPVAAEQSKEPGERTVDLTGVDRFALEAERRRHECVGD